MRTDDGSIIQTCLNGEPEAFGVLVDKYKGGIFAYIYARVNNFQDAQEITQDAFLCAFRDLHSLKRYESFSFWLFRIASNLSKKWLRNQIRHPQPESIDDVDPKAIDNSSIKSYHEEMMNQSVREALNTLPETYREVLMLYYFGDMDSKEIAESLGTSPTAIRMRLSRARELFKEEMIAMMGTAFEHERLHASFTFRIVEAIKRIKIQPISQAKGLPWGISLATGLIAVVLAINPHFIQFNWDNFSSFLSSSNKAKVLEVGEFPVNILETSQIPNISKGISEGKGESLKQPDIQNAFLMAPQVEGGKWLKKADMPTARYGMSASVVDENIYVIGGWNNAYLKTVEMYDTKLDRWETKASLPQGSLGVASVTVDGKIYAFGGWDGGPDPNILEEYDPVADKWTRKANMPTARNWASAAVVDGIIYAIGGSTEVEYTSAVEVYNPAVDQWSKKASLPFPSDCWTAVVNRKIYAMGWFTSIGGGDVRPRSDVYEYDPKLNTWTKKADMPTARMVVSAIAVNGKIYAVGGLSSFNPYKKVSTVEIYDPNTDTWEKGVDLPDARGLHVGAVVDGKIYIIGGVSDWPNNGLAMVLPNVEVFDTGLSVSPQGKLPKTWGKLKAK